MPDQVQVADLRRRLGRGLQRQLLHGSLAVLRDRRNSVRAHLFAAGLRELFGLTLETLAPDEEIKKCSWFEPEPNTSGPTRRQRAVYATRGGLSDDYLKDELDIDPDTLQTEIGKAFNELNKRTHVRPKTHIKKPRDIEAFADSHVEALLDVFRQIDELRNQLAAALEGKLEDETIQAMMQESIGSLDEISGHHSIETVGVTKTKVTGIDVDFVRYHITGWVDVELSFGGSGDDGASMVQSFPFECEAEAPVDDPEDIEAETPSVDTSSWFGNDVDPD